MRKDRYAEWAKLSATRKPKPNLPPIVVRDLPGVRELENKLFLYAARRGPLSPELEEAVHQLSLQLFGITRAATEFEWPSEYWDFDEDSVERWKIERWRDEHERQFETEGHCEEDIVAILKRFGLDFSDERGEPLQCTRFLSRQAEAAAKRVCGKMPDRGAAQLHNWESQLAEDAAAYLRSKKAG